MAGPGERTQAEELETEPVLRYARGFVRLGQGRFEDALAEFRAAETVGPSLAREHVLPVEVRGWILHTQGLLGETAAVRATLAGLDATSATAPGCASPPRRSRWPTAARRMRWTCWRR